MSGYKIRIDVSVVVENKEGFQWPTGIETKIVVDHDFKKTPIIKNVIERLNVFVSENSEIIKEMTYKNLEEDRFVTIKIESLSFDLEPIFDVKEFEESLEYSITDLDF